MNLYMGYTIFGEEIYVDESNYSKALTIINENTHNDGDDIAETVTNFV